MPLLGLQQLQIDEGYDVVMVVEYLGGLALIVLGIQT